MNTHIEHDLLVEIAVCRDKADVDPTVSEHIKTCETCRAELARLQSLLRPLELLNEKVDAPQTLIAETIASLPDQKHGGHIIRFPLLYRVAAAAALLAVAFGVGTQLMQSDDSDGEHQGAPPIGRPTTPSAVDFAAMRSEKPFPPASAIELNVLPARDDVQLTIYNAADLTLVRERRNLTLKQGWNWLQYMWANTLIDPTSLELRPLAYAGDIDVDALLFPPRLKQIGRWSIFSKISGSVPFEITYLTSGLSWRAFYMGTLSPDETRMDLEAYVRIDNASGEDYDNAQTRLIVGKVNMQESVAELARRTYPYGSPVSQHGLVGWDIRAAISSSIDQGAVDESNSLYFYSDSDDFEVRKPKEILKQGLSEYVLYTIEGKERIPDGWAKRLPSMRAESIPVVNLYKHDEERWGNGTMHFLSFANDEAHELGDTPLPQGVFRGFRRVDSDGLLSYVGQSELKYIPVGEDVEMLMGKASLVSVDALLMSSREENHTFDTHGDLTGWDDLQGWKLTVENARDISVSVEITRGLGSSYWALEGVEPAGFNRHDATHARLTAEVPARTRLEIPFGVRIFRGHRETAIKEQR